MRKKKLVYSVLLILAFSISSVGFITTVNASPRHTEYKTMDIDPKLREIELPADIEIPEGLLSSEGQEYGEDGQSDYYVPGTILEWATYDIMDPYQFYSIYFTDFELRAIGTYAEVWVQVDLSYPDGTADVVTDEQVNYILNEVDNNIYPNDTNFFGTPYFHNGSFDWYGGLHYEESGRSVILISNVRDTQYYDPSYPYFVIGFYWRNFEILFDRNIITLDSLAWDVLTGDPQYAYEATTAHEYQHLIHDDYNPNDATFMNEGCSVFAEMLCGYGTPWNDINSYLATPDNSLTVWEDQPYNDLADYGAVGLWAIYLTDRFGDDFLSGFVKAGIPGIEGLNDALAPLTFDEVYHDWRIANLIHSDWPGCGKYNYKSIDLAEADPVRTYEISGLPVGITYGTDFGNTITILGYDTGISKLAPYGSDYIVFTDWQRKKWRNKFLYFDGDDIAVHGWTEVADDLWYSGASDLFNTLLYGEVTVDSADPTLKFTSYWDIEDYWDFGFVQVSTDGGSTWTSLENEYTTDSHYEEALPDIIANLPGLTGWSVDYLDLTFDLSAYSGQTILVGFRYMTDLYTTFEGWYVYNPTVSGTALELTPIYDELHQTEADFQVTLIYVYEFKNKVYYFVNDMWLNDETEFGITYVSLIKPQYAYLIVSPINDAGYADYSFAVPKWKKCRWDK
ncbi:MAG: hypothetical protein ACFFB5_11300 [Promethearchaeota archaeon]